jgi:hypothetical protein
LKKRTSINSIPRVHKEKEMADFRKWFYALAMVAVVVGLTVPASAQSSAVTCNTNASVPTLARAQGYAELVGDYVLVCTGGTPTAAGQVVPQVNVSVFLTTNVTSKITGSGLYDEALLVIDEPNTPGVNSTKPILNCGNVGAPDTGISGPGVCSIISDGDPALTYDGVGGVQGAAGGTYLAGVDTACVGSIGGTYGCGHPNIFQGRLGVPQNTGQNNIVVFAGVPFDPPGSTTSRTLRITNVRADAELTGVASTFAQAQIQMNVSFTGTTFVSVNNPQQIVAYVQNGLNVVTDGHGNTFISNLSFLQCNSENPNLTLGKTTLGFDIAQPTVRFQEGFNNAWKAKNIAFMLSPGGNGSFVNGGWQYGGTTLYPADLGQNVPGANYNTESGFEWVGTGTTNQAVPSLAQGGNPPNGVGTSTVASNGLALYDPSTGISTAGVASQGTRLALSFANVPTGASLWLYPVLYLYRQNSSVGSSYAYTAGSSSGVMVLTSTDANGDTAFTPVTASSTALQQVSNSLAVYEILFADPNSLEQVDVPVVVSYVSNLSANPPVGLPVTGTPATVAGGFAPFYSTSTARQPSSTLPVPRFVPGTTPLNVVQVTKCACDLLFPYVVSAGGFDTGIAIANTSLDPFGLASPQEGAVQFWYYGGNANGGSTPGSQTSSIVPSGGILTYVLSNGSGSVWSSSGAAANGLSGVPGLVGYIIAQAGFQYCHAFAYISSLGAGPTTTGISEGYLGIVLDSPFTGLGFNTLPRTTQRAENDAH